MSKHTPTPWDAQGAVIFGDANNPKHDGDSPFIGKLHGHGVNAKANAAFIVKAVNHHDELVEALRAVLPYIGGADEGEHVTSLAVRSRAIKQARALLARIEGGKRGV